jgi:hypothetical protein
LVGYDAISVFPEAESVKEDGILKVKVLGHLGLKLMAVMLGRMFMGIGCHARISSFAIAYSAGGLHRSNRPKSPVHRHFTVLEEVFD